MKQLLLLFSLFATGIVHSQTTPCEHTIKGKVLDVETKKPIPYVTVRVDGTEKYDLTNKDGEFFLDGLCSEINALIISCLGYSDTTHKHHHGHEGQSHILLTPKVVGLDEVTIQAEKNREKGTETIAQIAVSKEDIVNDPTQSLASALSTIQGVTFTSTGSNVQLPVIHGLFGNRILVLNNGFKHGFQNWGRDHAPEIDITSANSVTVVKGAAGVRFGPEALGGAIIVESNPLLLNNPFYASVGTGYQTNGQGYNANLEIGSGSENWSYFANGSYVKIGDREAPNYNLTNSGKEEKAFSFGVLRHLKNWDFKVQYSFIDQNLALLRATFLTSPDNFIDAFGADEPLIIAPFSYNINPPNQTVQHHLAKAEVNWWYSDQGKLTLRGGIQLNKRDEFDVRRNSELPIIDLDLLTYDYQLEWEHPKWKGLDGLIGLQYFSQNNDNNPGTQTTPFIPNYNTDRFSAFAIENLNFGKHTLEAGIRFDFETNDVRGRETNQDIFRDNYDFTNFTLSLGYVNKLNGNSTFRTNIGTAWRTPNVYELFSFGQQGVETIFGLLRLSDDNGTPSTSEVIPLDESSVDSERGYKWVSEFQTYGTNNSHNLTFYTHYIENYIYDRPLGVFGGIRGPNTAFFFDQSDALFLGLDYTWKSQFTEHFSGTFGLSYLWSRNIEDSEPLIDQPPIFTSFELQWNMGNLGFLKSSQLSIRPSYTFEQFQAPRTVSPQSLVDGSEIVTSSSEIFDFVDPPEGYFLLDLTWSAGWKNLRASITANNLLNTSYRNYLNELRYYADEPGRNIIFTLNYSFKSNKND